MAVRYAQHERSSSAADTELVADAIGGDMSAFAELYRRHAGRALSVARTVSDNEEDARDAVAEAFTKVLRSLRRGDRRGEMDFRPYLLVATRHAAVDIARRRARVAPTRDLEALDSPSAFDQTGARAVANEDGRLITRALARLSEREQRLLWLLDVEDKSLRTAAAVLGVKPNHAAQIAMRARQRLRKAYVRACLPNTPTPACALTVERLPGYIDRGLSGNAVKKVDEHLGTCARCRQRLDDLGDLGLTLRRALVFPALIGSRISKWWPRHGRGRVGARSFADAVGPMSAPAASSSGGMSSSPFGLVPGGNAFASLATEIAHAVAAAAPAVQHFVAAASATVLVVGLSGLGGGADPPRGTSVEQQRSQEMRIDSAVAGGLGASTFGPASSTALPSETSNDGPPGGSPAANPSTGGLGPPAHAGPPDATGPAPPTDTPAAANPS